MDKRRAAGTVMLLRRHGKKINFRVVYRRSWNEFAQ